MSTIDEIFSEENMLRYADACIDLAVDLPQFKNDSQEAFDTLIIPSRGAVPFFLGMVYALEPLKEVSPECDDFLKNLGVQEMLAPLLPDNSSVSRTAEDKNVRVLLAPFTADLNIERYDNKESNDDYTQRTRDYWARVTASLFKPLEERANDPYFSSFVDVVLRDIEGRTSMAENYSNFPQISSVAMIDTVISGRAATQIFQSFDQIAEESGNDAFRPYSYLIIDENGSKLKPAFSRFLNIKRAKGEVKKMYEVPRIVSEDEGASLLGVSAVVYPSVMKASKMLSVKGKEFFVGAGSWRLGAELGQGEHMYKVNFRKFMDLVYASIDARFANHYGLGDAKLNSDRFRTVRKDVAGHIAEKKVLSINDPNTDVLCLNHKYRTKDPYETGSHVVHVPFDVSSTDNILSRLCALPTVFCHDPLRYKKRN